MIVHNDKKQSLPPLPSPSPPRARNPIVGGGVHNKTSTQKTFIFWRTRILLLLLQTENRRLARSIKKQKPFYSTWEMEKQEEERQILLKTMSRTQRRKERVALFSAAARGGPFSAGRGTGGDGVRGTTKHSGGRSSFSSSSLDDTAATASLVEDGILFRPGPTAVRLRTAKQMQLEVARRRRGHQEQEQGYFASSFSSSNNRPGSGGESGGNNNNNAACHGDGAGGGGWGGTLGGGISSSSTTNDSITVRRRGYSHDNSAANGGKGVILEVNRTGGRRRVSDGGSRRAGTTGEGRPNMIFTPSLVPVGVESVRSRPMSLGDAGREGSVRWAEEKGEHDGENSRGVEQERGGGGAAGSEEGSGDGIAREARTV